MGRAEVICSWSQKSGGKTVIEIITTVTIRIGGIKLNTKTLCWLKQASVSVEKSHCSCDEPAPLPAFGELGGGGDRGERGGSVH